MKTSTTIRPIERPLGGERVVQLSPEDAVAAAATWLRRPNLFPGRALTAPTLAARSDWAAGHIAQRGQAYTAGVVQGLELDYRAFEAPGEGERRPVTLYLNAGRGLAVSGEDVLLTRAIEVDFWALPVVAPPAVFDGGGFGSGALQPRAIGPALGELLDTHPDVLPAAGVLVLQPVLTDLADIDPDDPCDRCGCAEGNVSYEDWRRADAVRLLWYAWPEDWEPLPPSGNAFRNRLAYRVFDAERELGEDQRLPWEDIGLAVGLMGVDGSFVPTFIDRAAVVRQGGRPRYSRLQLSNAAGRLQTLASSVRMPMLWQAQIEQLAGQIAGFDGPVEAAVLARYFDRLPPCGVLPRNVVDLTTLSSAFFPGGFDLDAVPLPIEQLDLAIREAGAMAPLDLSRGERLRLLVPVSQASWEPDLLLHAEIDPLFDATLQRFLIARAEVLAARQSLRLKGATLITALRGAAPDVPAIDADPQAAERETLDGWGPPPGNGGHRSEPRAGVHEHGFQDAGAVMQPAAGESLYSWVYLHPDAPPRTLMFEYRTVDNTLHRAFWGEDLIARGATGDTSRLRIADLPESGRWVRLTVAAERLGLAGQSINGMSFVLYDGRVAYAATGRATGDGDIAWFDNQPPDTDAITGDEPFDWLTQVELLGPFERHHGIVLGDEGEMASEVLADLRAESAMQTLSSAERAQLTARGIEGFIDYLKSRADRADDMVDYGFVKVQTDIYRVRQLVLDTTEATRLAVSPTLAGIAKAETATASKQDLTAFFTQLQSTTDSGDGPGEPIERVGDAAPMMFRNLSFAAQPSIVAPAVIDTSSPRAIDRTSSTDTIARGSTKDQGELAFVREQAGDKPIKAKDSYTPIDIVGSTPIPGKVDIRTLSIADRLQMPKAQETRDYSTSTRHDAISRLVRLADELMVEDGGVVPGLFDGLELWGLENDGFLEDLDDSRRSRPIADFIAAANRPTLMAALLRSPIRDDADEAALFSDSADLSDRTIALFRQLEGRIKAYRDIITLCQQARKDLLADLSVLLKHEHGMADAVAEARHDVAVTRALIAEEQARIDAINLRRQAVLAEEVRFIAYCRPRAADSLTASRVRTLNPGLLPAPIPECRRSQIQGPDDLHEMLSVLREAPAAWFGQGPSWVAMLDRMDLLLQAMQTAQWRSNRTKQRWIQPASPAATGLQAAVYQVQAMQYQNVGAAREKSQQINIKQLAALSWHKLHLEAVQVVSLGDLIDGEHGRGKVARRAADFFDQFSDICACLHAAFSEVPAVLRLDWAETLSQFDKAPNLRNLGNLSRFDEIGYADRRRLQALTDWLFDQIETRESRALALINDIVRMCLLLASHAPIGRIVTGRLPRPVRAKPGVYIPVQAIDPKQLRVGMEAMVYRDNTLVARARVEDMGQTEASARVTYTAQTEIELDEQVRVQFTEASSVSYQVSAQSWPNFAG